MEAATTLLGDLGGQETVMAAVIDVREGGESGGADASGREIEQVDERSETKGERTAKRLLEIAVRRFGDRGFRATSVSEIAREAGLTQAAVYAYYESKTALFDAAVDHDAEQVIARARAEVAGTDALALIPALLVASVGALEDHPLVRRVLRGEEPDALARLINLPVLGDFTSAIAAAVRGAQDDGTVRGDLDANTFAEGAGTIMLALLLGMEQLGNDIDDRRRVAVSEFFAETLRATA